MATPQHMDRQTFLAKLRQSGLVSDDQLAEVSPKLPDSNRGRLVARSLVELGLLTKFQAERLLAGATGGFQLGQYLILDQLGQGGMGRVFKAEHRTMNRIVALKVLAPSLLKTEKAQVLFQREVRAVAKLIHPNIVTAYDANQVGDRSYLVLEYVDGPNLEQLVHEQGPLPVGQACELVRQIAIGLQYAHEMGMVHRDIKPANVLLHRGTHGSPDVVKISDFGLARLADTRPADQGGVGTIITKQNTVMGTPDYLSPEQGRNMHQADIRSDLYSLGCSFYYLLTGQVPFAGGNTLEKLVRHNTEPALPLEELAPQVPPPIAEIVRKLMAKDPQARFQTPMELADALAPFAESSGLPWKANKPEQPFVDLSAELEGNTPHPEATIDPFAMDDASVLAGTLPPGLSPTPVSATGLNSATRHTQEVRDEQRQRTRLAVLLAVGIVGGILAVATVWSLLL